MLTVAEQIVSKINVEDLAAVFGVITDKDDAEEQEKLQQPQKTKKALIEALKAKVGGLGSV